MRAIGKFLWRFMVIFSFIVNFVLVVILLLAGLFIFQIKAQVADPLIGGLHSTAAGLSESTIDWVIPVRDNLPINLEVPINSTTILPGVSAGQPGYVAGETFVTLTRPVPITIQNANINAGNLQLSNATVDITLPQGTQLPVALDLAITLNTEVPVNLDVRAVIPVGETQINDPFVRLGLLFEPLAVGLYNLPNNFSEAGNFAGQLINNRQNMGQWLQQQLLSTDGSGFNQQPYEAWQGFTQTAGYDYTPLAVSDYPVEARPISTGINIPGGIPALDALLPSRSGLYENGTTPTSLNAFSAQAFNDTGIPAYAYDGSFGQQFNDLMLSPEDVVLPPLDSANTQSAVDGNGGTGGVDLQTDSTNTNDNGSGIIPTPSN